ncbi:MAG: chromosomal replication initiator protein DnaA [Alphaproteobacteria bacterium]|nr:chromosomal replication initiator protein DnaA [Alphaproteobacteria bacterium]
MNDNEDGHPQQWHATGIAGEARMPADCSHAPSRLEGGKDPKEPALDLETGQRSWDAVCEKLRAMLGRGPYASWCQDLRFVELSGGQLVLAAPGRYAGRHVESSYGPEILRLWVQRHPETRRIRIISVPRPAPAAEAAAAPPPPPPASGDARPSSETVGVPLDPALTFARFVVGPSNEAAYLAARSLAEESDTGRGPLVIYGPSGFGKTHLALAIGNEVRARRPGLDVVYLPVEHFVSRFGAAAAEAKRMHHSERLSALKARLRAADLLIIDDFHEAENREKSQAELFETVREVIDRGGRVVIVANRPPLELAGIEQKLRARLVERLAIDVQPADYELRLRVLKFLAGEHKERCGKDIPSDVLELLAQRIVSTIRELKGAFNRLEFFSINLQREISMTSVVHVLADMLRGSERRLTVDLIQRNTAEYFGVTVADIVGKERTRNIVQARHVAMYLSRTLVHRSYPDLGNRFGGKDHTSVLFGVRKIRGLIETDRSVREAVETLTQRLVH